jgi:NAD(P)-dependent dehydrogenase (short-subunit alcohol dehydrogenase family)
MENNTIIISGANGNVGSYFAENLSLKNRLVLLINQKNDRIKPMLCNDNIALVEADITNYSELQAKLDLVINSRKWQPTALIHTASVRSSDFVSLVESNPEQWHKVVEVNLLGTFHLLKTVIPYFQKENYGRILLFGSNVSRIGLKKGSAYASTKAAIANICRSVALELADENILINTISPGPIQIDDSHFSQQYRQFRNDYYEREKTQIPQGRIASFDDLFELSKFLISPQNTYLTGEEIFITGGKL